MAKKVVRDKEQKINKIILTSLKLIQSKGYDNVSTNHIAERAGVAIGTIYKYFPNGKTDILRAIYKKTLEQRIEELVPEKIDLKNIEDLKTSKFYKDSLIQNISEHREYKSFIEAYETECLTNKNFYLELKDVYFEPSILNEAIRTVFEESNKKIKNVWEKHMAMNQNLLNLSNSI